MQALDLYSPFILMAGGCLGLIYSAVLGRFLKGRTQTYLTESIESVHQRFASRTKLSWVLLVFGSFWALQIWVERFI